MTHAEATQLVLGKNNRMQRKVANNTTARIKPDGSVAFMLYSTDVVTIHDDDSVTLRHGGHKTPTTKDRINKFSPLHQTKVHFQCLSHFVGFFRLDYQVFCICLRFIGLEVILFLYY